LGGAEEEAERVARMYARPKRLGRREATVAAFKRHAPDADVIHVATHGTGEVGRGSAALLLADGRLDAGAIAALRLPSTTAVVLAACESGRGPARPEGTISVARGFLAAGVPEVAATLWAIDDRSSAQFFPRVHQHFLSGLSLRQAVREAQLESIRRGEPATVWAAVQCVGS
jgi:CHAT domain-containing protein